MKLGLKFGFKMLLRNPVRIAASLLAAIAAFGIAGMCIFTQTYNIVPWAKELFFEYSGGYPERGPDPYIGIVWNRTNIPPNMSYNVYFTKDGLEETEELISDIGGYAIMYRDNRTPKNIEVLDLYRYINCEETRFWGDHNGEKLFAPYPRYSDDIFLDTENAIDDRARRDITRYLYDVVTVYSGNDAMQAFGYDLVGELPAQVDEIAIPQWLYNCFLCYGYKDRTGTVYTIEQESDILGKTLELKYWDHGDKALTATIVGVVHTDLEKENFVSRLFSYESVDASEGLTVATYSSYEGGSEYIPPPHMGVIVSESYLLQYARDDSVASVVVVPRYQSYSEQYFDLFYQTGKDAKTHQFYRTGSDFLRIASSAAVVNIDQNVRRIYESTSIYFRVVPYLGVFAAILLAYLCFSTVMGRRRGVGTLQSLGASKKQIALAVGIPIFVFCLIASLGALCVEVCFLMSMNRRLENAVAELTYFFDYAATGVPYPFILGWETVLFTFGVPLAIAAVATLVTVWLVFRTPVVDNLNKKEFRLFSNKAR